MNNFYDNKTIIRTRGISAQDLDMGLRAYMIKVFNLMALALALTGITAFAVSTSPALMVALFGTPLKWVVLLAPLGMVFFLSYRIHALNYATAQMVFWAYSALVGVSLSTIFMVYQGASIARVFFITAATFGATALYGYTTKRDLTSMGSFLFMGMIGLVIASIVNLFFHIEGLQSVLSYIGVLIFTGLTAYDTQVIKDSYYEAEEGEQLSKVALMGALKLYLDFINLFLHLLRVLGDRK